MRLTVDIEGLNLEKLLRAAAQGGITLRQARRLEGRTMRVSLPFWQMKALRALCERFGWELREHSAGPVLRSARFLRRRCMLAAGMLLCAALVYASSQMILAVRVEGAQENVAEVRVFLQEAGVRPGRLKQSFSLDSLREQLALRLPGLSFAGVRYMGSTLLVDCQPAREGEQVMIAGSGMDIVATQSGIITHIYAGSGTPQVEVGQAVYKGQVLISGQERTQAGEVRTRQAQGEVRARVWARGDARVSLRVMRTVETGQTRTRVTIKTPWSERVVRDAQPFDEQDQSTRIEPVVGLFLPLWREIETYAEITVVPEAREKGDAASMAQGAAEEIAKKQCPSDAIILDKWVDYSMIDDEFVYATVVLEYEDSIGGRNAAP